MAGHRPWGEIRRSFFFERLEELMRENAERAAPQPGEPISHSLWRLRFLLEDLRQPGDGSLVWLGELANALEEHDVANVEQLREALIDSDFLRDEKRGL